MEKTTNKGLIILANGFEESEAIITIDLLRRAKVELDLVSMEKDLNVVSSGNIKVVADLNFRNINLNEYEFLIIPGGKAVFNKHLDSLTTKSIIDFFINKNKLVACICAAPMILGKYGYLKGIEYTCFPGCENEDFNGILVDKNAVRVGNIITAKAMGATFDFSELIIEYLKDKELSLKVLNDVYYQKATK